MSRLQNHSWKVCALAGVCVVMTAWIISPRPHGLAAPHNEPVSSDRALQQLCAGNTRFIESRRTLSTDTARDGVLRRELAKGQHPFAAVLCCADSRICPEFIFDQPPGSIFEIRNAGNVVDEDVMASLEYAVEHLHVQFILVMAHKGCGAIAAVHEAGEKPLHDHLRALQEHMQGIRQEVQKTHDDHSEAVLDRLSRENARQQALLLFRESEPVKAAAKRGEIRLMFGLYDMLTGVVEFSSLD